MLTWYPITPSSSLAEYAEEFLKKHRVNPDGKRTFAVVQAEDELAAVGMAIGAGWAGARALTATAGPGISLMSEFVGLAYFAEIPVVIIDVQRMGPSTGPAHPDQPGGHPQAPPPGPRRLPPHRLDPRLGRGVLLADHRGPRPGPAVPDSRCSWRPTSTWA